MTEVLIAPDAEAVVIAGLAAGLAARGDTASVSTRIPSPRPGRLVRVRRRGGPRTDLVIDNPLILLECWAPTETDAADLAALVAGLFAALDGQAVAGHTILHAEILGGPSNDPDPDSATPRYTLTGQLRTYATAA